MEFLLVLLVLAAAVLLISGPLRRVEVAEERESAQRGRLEAAREAKYREIRELELDFRTGKLTREDYRAQDAARRAEAVEILRALDELDAGSEPQGRTPAEPRAPGRSAGQAERQAAGGPPGPAEPQAAAHAGAPVTRG